MPKKKHPLKKQNLKIGSSIKSIRKSKGYGQSEFCNKNKISQPYLSLVENNRKLPSIPFLKKLSDALEVPMVFFFWQVIDEDTIPENKKEAYKILKPSVDKMLIEIFKDGTFN